MKKLLKVLKYLSLTIVAVIVVSISWFFISNQMFIGFQDKQFVSYLDKNSVPIKEKIDTTLFDKAFYGSDIFLLGEIHGYADNQKMDRLFLEFLNQRLGVRYYIAEMDSSTATKLNRFLSEKKKNHVLLKEVVVSIGKRIPQQSSKELLEKWDSIYEYNQKQKDSLKIVVIGVDSDFDDENQSMSRDSAMIVNFKNAVEKLQIQQEKFYGFFGLFHTLQNNLQDANEPFASRLKKSGFKTTSIVSLPLDSEMYLPKNSQFPTPPEEKISWVNSDGPLVLVKGINDLKPASQPNTITLFKIAGKGSPYTNSQKLINIKSRIFGDNIMAVANAKTTDYFQYVIVTQNSSALSKLN